MLPWELPENVTKPEYRYEECCQQAAILWCCIVSRLCALSFVLLLQLWVGWTFLSSQMERAGTGAVEVKPKLKTGREGRAGKTKTGMYGEGCCGGQAEAEDRCVEGV